MSDVDGGPPRSLDTARNTGRNTGRGTGRDTQRRERKKRGELEEKKLNGRNVECGRSSTVDLQRTGEVGISGVLVTGALGETEGVGQRAVHCTALR